MWMKLNQFGFKEESFQTAVDELTKIGFLDEQAPKDVTALWFYLLEKSFPEVTSEGGLASKYRNLLANSTTDLYQFKQENLPLSQEVFYLVGLQLLEFQLTIDFNSDTCLADAKKIGIPVLDASFDKTEDLIKAWYMLLNTHNKKALTFIDSLASRGYYSHKKWPLPLFFNGKAQAVFDTNEIIREVVYVESSLDTDQDGKRDLIKVEILRPKETETGLKVPSLFTASPYCQGINPEASDKMMHNPNQPLTRKEPNDVTYETIQFTPTDKQLPNERIVQGETTEASETFMREQSYTFNDYFLPRGFAAVYSAGIGSKDSDGIQTCGSVEQTESMTAVIKWLAGNRRAFTNRTDNIEIKAWWSNHKVAMTGRSYLGTLATAAATTGVAGLETIISEAAISDWYQYYRDNGLVVAPGGFPGEDADVLAELTFSRMHTPGDYLRIKDFFNASQKELTRLQDRETGNYNTFWDERNYLPHVKDIKIDVVMVHGLNDWNVKPRHVYQLWEALKEVPVAKKIILHQGQHIYINNMPSLDFNDMMNLWLSHKLYDLDNHAKELLPDVIYQDNTQPENWLTRPDWTGKETVTFNCHKGQLVAEETSEVVTFSDQLDPVLFDSYTKNFTQWEKDLCTEGSPLDGHRYLMKSTPLKEELILSGEPTVKLKVASNQDIGMLSVRLVDFGTAKRLKPEADTLGLKAMPLGYQWREDDLKEFKLDKETDFKLISVGHINLQNRENPWKNDDLQANQWVEVEFALQPTLYHLPKGRQLGLVIYSTDFSMTIRGNQDLSYSINLNESSLHLPTK